MTKTLEEDMKGAAVMQKVKKVAICVPVRGAIESDFLNNYLTLFVTFFRKAGVIPIPIFSDGMPLDKARNDLVLSAIEQKADYLFFLDADVHLDQFKLEKLWEFLHSRDGTDDPIWMVSGIYYQREIPYTPVIRMESEDGKMMPVPAYDRDRPFEIHGAGMGCFLAKAHPIRQLFIQTEGKPFQFHKDISEDLFFCREMRKLLSPKEKPYKIWCHPDVQCGHWGAFVHEWHYLHYYGEQLTEVSELHAYLASKGIQTTKKAILERCYKAPYDISRKFAQRFPDLEKATRSEIDEYYRTADDYLYDLTKFWIDSKKKIVELFDRIPEGPITALDYGCGIGDYGLLLMENRPVSHVDFVDVSKPSLDYLRWRLAQRKQDLTPLNTFRIFEDSEHVEKIPLKGEFDLPIYYNVVFCLEVLEHLKDPETHVKRIRSLMDKNGLLFCTQGPMSLGMAQHISAIRLEDHGFICIGKDTFVRTDSDIAKRLGEMKI